MKPFNFYLPTRIRFERGGLDRYLPEIGKYGKKILLVTGRRFALESGLVERIMKILAGAGLTCSHFFDVDPEPTVENVEAGAAFCRKEGCDAVLAVGGGSAMDAAKGMAVLAVNDGSLRDYFGEVSFRHEPLPVVAVPTTCGTGSEITRYAVIVERRERTKKTVSNELLIPKLAVMDADLLDTLPERLVAATGMDAFSHALEGFLANKANDMTRFFSLESMRILHAFLPRVGDVSDRKETRERIFFASLVAGFVINHTGTILIHGMGYSLTIKHAVHHGTANGLLLPYVVSYLKEHGYGAEIGMMEKAVLGEEPENLFSLVERAGLPTRLSALGIREEELDELTDLAMIGCQRSYRNMKKPLARDEVRAILRQAL